ncbi:MAG: hypothetical protein WBF53_04425 [Litorimonas sp.]
MADLPKFSDEKVQAAIQAAHDHYADHRVMSDIATAPTAPAAELSLSGGCISVKVEDGKVCVELPLGIGKICIPIPVHFDADVAQACIKIKSTWGIPTGLCLTISIAGTQVAEQCFGL